MDKKSALLVYTFSHFCVDFACFFMLFSWAAKNPSLLEMTQGMLIYNVIAFGFQPLIGFLCYTYKKIPIGAFGCALLIFGLIFMHTCGLQLLLWRWETPVSI